MVPSALLSALDVLACPHCGRALSASGRSLRCEEGHAFDIARQGYVNLLPGARRHESDTAGMVAARESAQVRGHFAPVADAVTTAVATADPPEGAVLDVGGGTGYYAAAALDALPGAPGVALDLSVYAARRAARAHPRLASVVADAWGHLPVRDGAVAVALSVFAPRPAEELGRVVAPGGVLVVVAPRPDHLAGLAGPVGMLGVDPDKEERLAQRLGGGWIADLETGVDVDLRLTRAQAADLVLMGPSAFHLAPGDVWDRLESLSEPLAVRISVTVRRFRRG